MVYLLQRGEARPSPREPEMTEMAKASKKKSRKAEQKPTYADHGEDIIRLKRIRGQVDGIERMVVEGRYCLDIVNQIRSAMAALKSVEGLVLERHVRHCVKHAIQARDERETEARMAELLTLFHKR